ncbi:MAG: gamma-glutamyltransferase, partial [Spirochaetia bacterium]
MNSIRPFSRVYLLRTSAVTLVLAALAACGPATLTDGEYVVYSADETSDGWHAVFRLQVDNEEIVDSGFDYVNAYGEVLSEQDSWNERLSSAYGGDTAEAFDSFAETVAETREFDPSEFTYNSRILSDVASFSEAAIEVAEDGNTGVTRVSGEDRELIEEDDIDRVDQDVWSAVNAYLSGDSPERQRRAMRGGIERPESVGGIAAVSQDEAATEAGIDVLEAGGTAADAVFAMSSVLSVVEPMLSSVFGGGTWMLYYDAEADETVSVDGVGPTPQAATIDRFQDDSYFGRRGIHRSIVPGAWAGWMSLLREYGATPLGELVSDAERIAREGHDMRGMTDQYLSGRLGEIEDWPYAADVYIPDGSALEEGDTIRHPDMADTFEAVKQAYQEERASGEIPALQAAEDYFYRGPIAEEIARFSSEEDGLLTYSDFANFEGAEITDPITIDYRGYDIHQSPPNSQGIVMLQALGMLRNFDFSGLGPHDAETVHRQAEALKLGFLDRHRYLGDPDFVDIDVESLLSESYLDRRAEMIDSNTVRTWPMDDVEGIDGGGDTTTLHAVDQYGNVAAVTTSIGISFIVAGETGIHMNERISFMSDDPDHPNAIEPGKKVRHTSMPYLAMD